jgi:hypothetical protein
MKRKLGIAIPAEIQQNSNQNIGYRYRISRINSGTLVYKKPQSERIAETTNYVFNLELYYYLEVIRIYYLDMQNK